MPDLAERMETVERALLDQGRRLAALEAHLRDEQELARLRHAELMHMISVAARDSAAKGAVQAEQQAGLAKAWRLWGWQTTLIVIVTTVANVAAQNVWRFWYVPRGPAVSRNRESPPLPDSSDAAVPGAGGAR
jgi:hypothetical protein